MIQYIHVKTAYKQFNEKNAYLYRNL